MFITTENKLDHYPLAELTTDGSPPSGDEGSSSLTLMDFLLVAELGRVLLFSWEELELFSSSSSSSSKLMLLEMPTVSRGQVGMSTHAFYSGNTGDPVWMHTQPLTLLHPDTHRAVRNPTHPDTYKDTGSLWCTHELGLVTILLGMHPHHPISAQPPPHTSSSLEVTSLLSLVYQNLS